MAEFIVIAATAGLVLYYGLHRLGFHRVGAILIAGAVGIYGTYRFQFPTYSWNQELRIVIDTPSGPVAGSTVINVAVSKVPTLMVDMPQYRTAVKGEAVTIDLDGRYLFALLDGAERHALDTFAFDLRKFPTPIDRAREVVAHWGQTKPLPHQLYPELVSFQRIEDPRSVVNIDPLNASAYFGPGYAVRSITISITREPVTYGSVDSVLSWVDDSELLKNPAWAALPHQVKAVIQGLIRGD